MEAVSNTVKGKQSKQNQNEGVAMATSPWVKTTMLTATVTLRLLTKEVKIYVKGSYDPKSNSWGGWEKNEQ